MDVSDLSDQFDDFAKLVKVASKDLYTSYTLDNKLGNIRASIFNNAKLYDDKIKPISRITIECIEDLCNEISVKGYLDIIEDAKSNQKLCAYTISFHEEILREFCELRNKMEDELLSIKVDCLEIGSQANCKTNETEQTFFTNENICPILGPLRKSISSYIKSLQIISGYFFILRSDLHLLNERIEQAITDTDSGESKSNYIHRTIIRKAKLITDSCSKYLKMDSNQPILNSINANTKKDDGWIWKVINKDNKISDFRNLLKEMNNSRLNSICDL